MPKLVIIDDNHHKELKSLAAKEGVTMKRILEDIIREYFINEEKERCEKKGMQWDPTDEDPTSVDPVSKYQRVFNSPMMGKIGFLSKEENIEITLLEASKQGLDLDFLEKNIRITKNQNRIGGGHIDLIGESDTHKLIIIELKVGAADYRSVGQIQSYLTSMEKVLNTKKSMGIIIAYKKSKNMNPALEGSRHKIKFIDMSEDKTSEYIYALYLKIFRMEKEREFKEIQDKNEQKES